MRAAVGLCKETAANSGIFEREWTKANISMDCHTCKPRQYRCRLGYILLKTAAILFSTGTPTITMK